MRITIDVEPGVVPVAGWLRREDDSPVAFQGMIELIALIDHVAEGPPDGQPPMSAPNAGGASLL